MEKIIDYQGDKYRYHQKSEGDERFIFFPATLLRRTTAYILDVVILLIVFFTLHNLLQIVGIPYLGMPSEPLASTDSGIFILGSYYFIAVGVFSGLQLIYFTALEYSEGASTLGKKFLNLKVFGKYGEDLTLKQSFIRNIFRSLWPVPSLMFVALGAWELPYIAFAGLVILAIDMALIFQNDQRIGDYLSSSFVIDAAEMRQKFNKDHLKNPELLSKKW